VFGASRITKLRRAWDDVLPGRHTEDDVDHTVERPIAHRPTSQQSL
jgi:hypothetical protein